MVEVDSKDLHPTKLILKRILPIEVENSIDIMCVRVISSVARFRMFGILATIVAEGLKFQYAYHVTKIRSILGPWLG